MRRIIAALVAAVARARAHAAFAPGARLALIVIALGVFAAIGSVAARGETAPLPSAQDAADAAADAPSALLVGLDPAPAPSAAPAPSSSSSAQPAPGPSDARGRASPDDPVYLNTATVQDLQRLPGIGPKKAQSIVALRQRVGRFRQVDELMRVRGIGRSTMKRLRPLVRLDPPGATADGGAGRS